MNSHQSKQAFKHQIAAAGLVLGQLTFAQGIALMLDFYRRDRAEDCPPESDGDMLLFQWGCYGKPDEFNLNLTRQFIIEEAEDENIWQLSLTFAFAATDDLRKIASGNRWCDQPEQRTVSDFEKFIKASEAYRAVSGLTPVTIGLDYLNAG